jgi:hypothetical protein
MDNLLLPNQEIKELPLSEEFKKMAEINGLKNMEEILSLPASFFLATPEVNYHLYKELADYLKENNLLHLLKHEY